MSFKSEWRKFERSIKRSRTLKQIKKAYKKSISPGAQSALAYVFKQVEREVKDKIRGRADVRRIVELLNQYDDRCGE